MTHSSASALPISVRVALEVARADHSAWRNHG
ncbi:hypothetical protein SUBG_00073 [Sulfitobacter phage pCB2047-C]|nr:hypothetical protein SUBG_00073 [Sulfitobacter phage pCB2047-C]AIE48238.1 hypothetical protein SUBG_00073 [Sulfitobacter phage pCB2047-C]